MSLIFKLITGLMSSATAKDDGTFCLVREHRLSTAFRSALWDTPSVLYEDTYLIESLLR